MSPPEPYKGGAVVPQYFGVSRDGLVYERNPNNNSSGAELGVTSGSSRSTIGTFSVLDNRVNSRSTQKNELKGCLSALEFRASKIAFQVDSFSTCVE